MYFMVRYKDGTQTYISGQNQSAFMSYKEMERKALLLAEKVGGVAHYENGNPRFVKGGMDLFPRWIPVGQDYSDLEKEMVSKYNIIKGIKV